jgi:hypothetical protein
VPACDSLYHLYRVPLHPELLEVVPGAAGGETRPAYRLRFALLRSGGHLLELRVGDPQEGKELSRVEVVAPASLELPGQGRLEVRPLGAQPDGLREPTGVPYACEWLIEAFGADVYPSVHRQLLDGVSSWDRRVVARRGHPENDRLDPFSRLDLLLGADRVEAFVAHAFPAEQAFCFLHCVFGLPGATLPEALG